MSSPGSSWSPVSSKAGLGWVLDAGQPQYSIKGVIATPNVRYPLLAEALALIEAMTAATQYSFTNVWFRSDSQEIIRAIDSNIYPIELYEVLMDIKSLSSTFSLVYFSFIRREFSIVADLLAKSALYWDCYFVRNLS